MSSSRSRKAARRSNTRWTRRPALPAYRHVLSGQLRLHPPYPVGGRRFSRLHGDRPDPGGTWCGRARAADRRAAQEDEKGVDEKIIAVPTDKLHPYYKRVGSYCDLPEILVEQIGHFFQHYKDLEKGKWVKVLRWVEPSEAIDLIRAGIERANS
jgi:hypothetical protein